jgi:hypothetical protein
MERPWPPLQYRFCETQRKYTVDGKQQQGTHGEVQVGAGVDGDAVILVVDLDVLDRDVVRAADVERVSVVAERRASRALRE